MPNVLQAPEFVILCFLVFCGNGTSTNVPDLSLDLSESTGFFFLPFFLFLSLDSSDLSVLESPLEEDREEVFEEFHEDGKSGGSPPPP